METECAAIWSSLPSIPSRQRSLTAFVILVLMLIVFPAVAAASEPVPAPPRVYIDTTWNPPTNGATYTANSPSSFVLALTFAQPGDTIVLADNVVFSGNFTLPAKANPNHQWIYIESSGLAELPPPGTRVGLSNEPYMAKIITPNGLPPLTIAPGASYYRLVGLEVATASDQGCNPHYLPPVNCLTFHLIDTPTGVGTPLADSITVDRCYIHGSPTQDARVGVVANGTNFAVIESYISDIHQSTSDSQGVLAYWTPGPLKIVDNYISATTEDIMFGGAGGYNDPYVPSDIEVRRNHFYKPLSWDQPGITLPPYAMWVEKNNVEIKSAQRVVITGNTLENTWVSGQRGYSVVLTVRTSQSGNIAVVDDILFESNILKNVDAGFNTLEQDNDCGAQYGYPQCTNPGESKRVKIDNNLILLSNNTDTTQHTWLDVDGGNSIDYGLTDWVVQHNTALMIDYSEMWNYVFNLPQMPWDCNPPQGFSATHNIWILDNAITRQPIGTCGFAGIAGLNWYMGDPSPLNPRYYGNVMWVPSNERVASWPPANDATTTPFTYVDPGQGNYQLLIPDWTQTTDGAVAGISYNELEGAMNP